MDRSVLPSPGIDIGGATDRISISDARCAPLVKQMRQQQSQRKAIQVVATEQSGVDTLLKPAALEIW